MTIDRDRLHALADETGRGYIHLSGGMLAGLLDALTRAEAQAAIRGRAVAIYQRRSREAETERDWNWRSSRHSKIERIKANARADRAEAEARAQRRRADDMEDNALRAQTNLRAAEERADEWRQATLEESAAQLPDASHIAQPPRDEKDEGVSDYTPEQRQAVTEALDGLADRLDRMADHADASDHWAWEYRYADEVREYLADWRKKYTQG